MFSICAIVLRRSPAAESSTTERATSAVTKILRVRGEAAVVASFNPVTKSIFPSSRAGRIWAATQAVTAISAAKANAAEIDGNAIEAWKETRGVQIRRNAGDKELTRTFARRAPPAAADSRQLQRFSEQHRRMRSRVRAQGDADGDLAAARVRTGQQQTGDVDGGDQEQED